MIARRAPTDPSRLRCLRPTAGVHCASRQSRRSSAPSIRCLVRYQQDEARCGHTCRLHSYRSALAHELLANDTPNSVTVASGIGQRCPSLRPVNRLVPYRAVELGCALAHAGARLSASALGHSLFAMHCANQCRPWSRSVCALSKAISSCNRVRVLAPFESLIFERSVVWCLSPHNPINRAELNRSNMKV